MRTWFFSTNNGFLFAVASGPAFMAIAFVALFGWIVVTHAAVQTRLIFAVAHLDVAFGAGETGRADACE